MERSIGDVMTAVAGNLERLVRAEVRLARATVAEGLRGMAPGAALVAAGVLLATLAVLLLLLGAVARVAEAMPLWQAAALMAGGAAVVSAVIVGLGIRALRGGAAHPNS